MVSPEQSTHWLEILAKVPRAIQIMEDLGVEEADDLLEASLMLDTRVCCLTHTLFGADNRGDQESCCMPQKGIFF